MELVPKEELDSSLQNTGNTSADKRAQKVGFVHLFRFPYIYLWTTS